MPLEELLRLDGSVLSATASTQFLGRRLTEAHCELPVSLRPLDSVVVVL